MNSKNPEHLGKSHRLNRVFPSHRQSLMALQEDSEGPDQTAQVRSLVWAFAVPICPEGTFSHGAAYTHKNLLSLAKVRNVHYKCHPNLC